MLSRQWLNEHRDADRILMERISELPERVIQIGEGRFVRGFVDWLINRLNVAGLFGGRVVVVAPRRTGARHLIEWARQDFLYTVWLRGLENGREVDEAEIVMSVSRGIDPYTQWRAFLNCAANPAIDICVSNTTEAGLAFQSEAWEPDRAPESYPGKLTAYLYRRYEHFCGDPDRGMVIVPCELVDDNGAVLRAAVLRCIHEWKLPTAFAAWVTTANHFCNTLVDRIVTGLPPGEDLQGAMDQFGYEDQFLTVGEPFHLFVIEDGGTLRDRWPLADSGLAVRFVDDVSPYRLLKVRILNGAHTALAVTALLAGLTTVRAAVNDELFASFVHHVVFSEIVPTLAVEPQSADRFAQAVLERFQNPYIEHRLQDIMLHALTKFRVRLAPTIQAHVQREGRLPPLLTTAFAALLLYYHPDSGACIEDRPELEMLVRSVWAKEAEDVSLPDVVRELLALHAVWGLDANEWPGATETIARQIAHWREKGARASVTAALLEGGLAR